MTNIPNLEARFIQPSFKGVPFFLMDDEVDFSTSVIVHEFASSDDHYNEDRGHMATAFTVRGYVSGEDWEEQRDNIRRAVHSHGAGTLVLPFQGIFEAKGKNVKVASHRDKMGRLSLEMLFVEVGIGPSLYRVARPAAELNLRGRAARAALVSDFALGWSVAGQSVTVRNAATSLLQSFAATAETLRVSASFEGATLGLGAGYDDGQALERALRHYNRDAVWLVDEGQRTTQLYPGHYYSSYLTENRSAAASRTADIMRIYRTTSLIDDRQKTEALEAFALYQAAMGTVGGVDAAQANCNADSFQRLIRAAALYELSQHIAEVNYCRRQDALTARARFSSVARQSLASLNTNGCHTPLAQDVKSMVQLAEQHLCEIVAAQGKRITITGQSCPAAVWAHILNGDLSNKDQIYLESGAVHPAFLPERFDAVIS